MGDMDARVTALRVAEFPHIIVGVKTAHYRGPEWTAVDRAVEAGRMAKVPVMVDFGEFVSDRPWRELVTQHLRPGDIYTHFFLGGGAAAGRQGQVQPYVLEARKRGIIFDVGHGGGSFVFRQAVPAIKAGVWPDSLSTDLHINSMNGGMKDMTNLMSKFLAMGMPLKDVMARSTWHPAREIKRPDLGHLGAGALADVAVFASHRQLRLRRRRRRRAGRRPEAAGRADRARRQGGLGPERHLPPSVGVTAAARARRAGALAAEARGPMITSASCRSGGFPHERRHQHHRRPVDGRSGARVSASRISR